MSSSLSDTVLWTIELVRVKSNHQLPVACLQSRWGARLRSEANQFKPDGQVLGSEESIPRCYNLKVDEQVLATQRGNATCWVSSSGSGKGSTTVPRQESALNNFHSNFPTTSVNLKKLLPVLVSSRLGFTS